MPTMNQEIAHVNTSPLCSLRPIYKSTSDRVGQMNSVPNVSKAVGKSQAAALLQLLNYTVMIQICEVPAKKS